MSAPSPSRISDAYMKQTFDERHDPNKRGWRWTYTGRCFWPLDPRAEDVCIEDIAHHLSMLCRYGGAIQRHYSVAQHCVLVADLAPEPLKLTALLHDAAEAYLIDVPRDVKRAIREAWDPIEDRVHAAICEWAGIDNEIPAEVKRLDNVLAVTEMRDLYRHPRPNAMHLLAHAAEPLPGRIYPWPAEQAEELYLSMYGQLTRGAA